MSRYTRNISRKPTPQQKRAAARRQQQQGKKAPRKEQNLTQAQKDNDQLRRCLGRKHSKRAPMTHGTAPESSNGFRQPRLKWDAVCSTCRGKREIPALRGGFTDCPRCAPAL